MKDDWLDAFEAADFEDPELEAVDDAVQGVLERLDPVAPTSRGWGRVVALGLVAAAALVALGWALGTTAESEPLPDAVVHAPRARVEPGPPSTISVPAEPVGRPAPAAGAPDRVEPDAVAEVVAVEEAPLSGLILDEAQVRFEGDGVVLTSGRLRYLHDATHEPGVRRVHLAALDLELRPVGTAFDVVAQETAGIVRVDDGRVQVLADAVVLATLTVGDELVAVPDVQTTAGVRLLRTTGLPLDAVELMVPDDCLCKPADIVKTVARMRLERREGR